MLAEAIASYEELKDKKEREYARLYLQYKSDADNGGVKVTETKLANLVLVDPAYVEIMEDFHVMSRQVGLLKSLSRSLEHRRDMLIQLSANIRREFVSGDYGFEADASKGEGVDLNKVRENYRK